MFARCWLSRWLFCTGPILYRSCDFLSLQGPLATASSIGRTFISPPVNTFPAPSLYSDGRFSNGPLWVERLAELQGDAPLAASLAGGNNYAFNGARDHRHFPCAVRFGAERGTTGRGLPERPRECGIADRPLRDLGRS